MEGSREMVEGWDAAHPLPAKIRQSNNEGKDLMTSKLQRTQVFLEPTKGNGRCEMMGRGILPLTELHLRYTKLIYSFPLTLWYPQNKKDHNHPKDGQKNCCLGPT